MGEKTSICTLHHSVEKGLKQHLDHNVGRQYFREPQKAFYSLQRHACPRPNSYNRCGPYTVIFLALIQSA